MLDGCRARGWSLAVAESCTGGLLVAALTSHSGSSEVVLGGVIAYADRVKTECLGVPRSLLAAHGAVSEPTALAMARGAAARLGADVGIGITGVAGPGRSGVKPPGLTYVAVRTPLAERARRLDRDRGREGNRAAAVSAALALALELLGAPRPPAGR